jgi:ABC-type multidrug transport system ATPase subunit
MLEVRGLNVRRGRQPVLEDVGFGVEEGALVGVIGPNGAGKTSLLESVAGVIPAEAGEVRVSGRAVPATRRSEAMFYLADGIRPCPDHRAGDVLDLFATAFDRPPSRVAEFRAALGLDGSAGKRVKDLSKGFAKRWLLAVAFMSRAPLLLLDEPLDGLDLRQVLALRVVLEGLRAEGRTLILSIHELSLAESLCETFLLLAGGRLLAGGDLATLRAGARLPGGGLADVFLALS